jgi:hypothetical protein
MAKDNSVAAEELIQRTPDEHIEALRKASKKDKCDAFEEEYFVDHIINTKLASPLFKKYISYRPWLTQLTARGCNGKTIMMLDTLPNKDIYRVEVFTEPFDSSEYENKLELDSTGTLVKINGTKPYGTMNLVGKLPETRIKIINVYKNGIPYNIPYFIYDQFLNPKVCSFILPQKIIEAYTDGDKLYIYIFGGNVSGAYLAKLIFEQGNYIGSIVSENADIGCYGNFHGDPLWY